MSEVLGAIGVALGFVFGIVAHGVATAWAAERTGDRTPRLYGRLTLKPKAHFDVLGSVVLPAIFTVAVLVGSPLGIMVGWGKRHALSPRARKGKSVVIPALAGPAATLTLALAAGVGARAIGCSNLGLVFAYFALVCVSLTVLELLPMPGRDGGRILATFLPSNAQQKMEELAQYDALFVIGVLLFLAGVFGRLAAPLLRLVLGNACS